MSWGEVKKINSNLAKALDTLIIEKLEEKISAISSWFNNTNSLINTLKTGTVPIVKSIQRGTFNKNASSAADYGRITINAINPNKSILRVCSMDYDSPYAGGFIEDATHIYLFANSKPASYVWSYSWEVVEFY